MPGAGGTAAVLGPGELALFAGRWGAVLDVVAQVGFEVSAGVPDLGEERPASQ